mgnify:CR=1 FL=1
MRPNLVMMLAFLIFLVGFFSSQVSLTGHSTRDSFYSSLSDEELARFGHLTVEDCRVTSLLSGYGARSHGLSTAEARGYDAEKPFISKSQYQLQYYDPDYDISPDTPDGRITAADAKRCYDIVHQRGEYARAPSFFRPTTILDTCKKEGDTSCADDTVVKCTSDAQGNLHWVRESRAGKAQGCRKGIIESLTVPKPWLKRLPP